MDTWTERQRVALTRCLETFEDQFREWEARTERAPWEIHYSQVRAATAHLGVLRDRLRQTLDEGQDNQIELRVLSAWRVWEAFRNRLGQRQEEMFRPGLTAADEIAWACRIPIAEAFERAKVPTPKQPPLAFLNGSVSPNALVRARPFHAEPVFGEPLSRAAERLLESLPVPLIGLPWHEAFHAPAMVAIPHEAGHVVEADFALAEALDQTLAAAAPARAADWKRWRAEVFADHFAVRLCGPAFVGLLIDLLAPRVATTPANAYPPHVVRMELCLVALEEQGLASEAAHRRRQWLQRVGPANGSPDAPLATDVRQIVRALGNLRVGNDRLADVVAFHADRNRLVTELAADVRAGSWTNGEADPTTVIATAWQVFEEDPNFFARQDATEEIYARIARAPGAGARRGRDPRRSAAPGQARRSSPADTPDSYAAQARRFADQWLAERLDDRPE